MNLLQRISINTLCLEPAPLAAHVETVARLGALAISPDLQDLDGISAAPARRLLEDAGLSVGTLTHRAFGFAAPELAAAQQERLERTIDLAHAIGSPSICLTTGGRGDLAWREAAERFAETIAPCAAHARAAGVALGLEPTSHLYADASIAHRLSDVVALARLAGIAAGIDFFACWVDSDIDEAIAAAGPICAFAQVSDHVPGDRGLPCRAVPGDGAIPLERLTKLLLAAGFRGPFDLEIIGPRLVTEGREAGLRRALAWMARVLERAEHA
jgi:sugar phosphate isomerase/epimerase